MATGIKLRRIFLDDEDISDKVVGVEIETMDGRIDTAEIRIAIFKADVTVDTIRLISTPYAHEQGL